MRPFRLEAGIYVDDRYVYEVRDELALIYCRRCTGLALTLALDGQDGAVKAITDSAHICTCRLPSLPRRLLGPDKVFMTLLNDLSRTVKSTIATTAIRCESDECQRVLDDAGMKVEQLIWRLASQQEMRR